MRKLSFILLLIAAWATRLQSADYVWDGDTSTEWSNISNWKVAGATPSALPDAGDRVFFTAISGVQNQPTIGATNRAVLSLDFDNSGAWTISGTATLTVGASGVVVAGGGTSTIVPKVTLSDAQSWSVGAAGNLTVNGALGGAVALTKMGTGQLTLKAASTRTALTATTTISSGVLRVESASAFSNSSALGATIDNGAMLEVGGVTLDRPLTLKNGATLRGSGAARSNGTVSIDADASVQITTKAAGEEFIIGNANNDLVGGSALSQISIGGGGSVLLNNSSNFAGHFNVAGATLDVRGTLTAAGVMTLGTGGVLVGTGSVTEVVVNAGGTISPGTAAAPVGTLTALKADFSGGGALNLAIVSPTSSDVLRVLGNLKLGGTSKLNLNVSGFSPVPGRRPAAVIYGEANGPSIFSAVTPATLGTDPVYAISTAARQIDVSVGETLTVPPVLAIELPDATLTQIPDFASPMQQLLGSVVTPGGLVVTHNRVGFTFPIGGTSVTWTASNGQNFTGNVYVFRHGQTPLAVTEDEYSTSGNHGSCVVRSKNGHIHVAWLDIGGSRPIRLVYRRGTQDKDTGAVTWTAPVDIGENTVTALSYVAMDRSENAVHFAWVGAGDTVRYRRLFYNGSEWSFEAIQNTGMGRSGIDNGPDIAAFNDIEVHVLTRALKYGYKLDVTQAAAAWQIETLPLPAGSETATDSSVKYPAIGVDSRGDVHLAFTNIVTSATYWRMWYMHRVRPTAADAGQGYSIAKWIESHNALANFSEWAASPNAGDFVGADWVDLNVDSADNIHLGFHGAALTHVVGMDDAYYMRRPASGDGNANAWQQPILLYQRPAGTLQLAFTPSFCTHGATGLALPVFMYKSLGAAPFDSYPDLDSAFRVIRNGQIEDTGPTLLSQGAPQGLSTWWPDTAEHLFQHANGRAWMDVIQSTDTADGSNLTFIVFQRHEVTSLLPAPNQPPVVNAGADQSVTLPASASLGGSASDDGLPAGRSLTTAWSKVSGPGTVTFQNANVLNTTALFSAVGTYTLRLTANDTDKAAADDVVVTVLIANQSPVFSSGASAAPNPAVPGTNVSFGAAASDSDADPLTYLWTFGDGSSATGASVAHAYAAVGTFNVIVTVSDGKGGQATSSVVVIVSTSGGNNGGGSNGGGGGGGGSGTGGGGAGGGPTTPPTPFNVSKMAGSMNFRTSNRDTYSISGTIPNLDAGFNPNGTEFVISLNGAEGRFVLNSKAKGTSSRGTVSLKLKNSKKNPFAGGPVAFSAKLKGGDWSDEWATAGFDPDAAAKNKDATMIAAISIGGTGYVGVVSVSYSAKAGVSGKFKKR